MSDITQFLVQAALAVMILLLLPCAYRVFVGPSAADRLQAVDTMTTILIGIIILVSLSQGSPFEIDIAIALAAFSFVATLAIARYLCEGRMF